MKAEVKSVEPMNVVDQQGRVRGRAIYVNVFEKTIGHRLISDMPMELASQLKVGQLIEVNGIDMNIIEPTGRD